MSEASQALRRAAIFPLLAIVFAVYLATLQSGHHWGDDFADYLHHARNLIDGHSYADTGLIENPQVRNLGPRYFPPGFPALLAPTLALFGFNYTALKIEVAVLFVLGLWLMYGLFRDRLNDWQALAAIALIGLNPVLWEMRNDIVSDLPFLTATYGSLYLMHWLYTRHAGNPPAIWGIAAGLSIYSAYAIRQPGLMLIPAMLCFELLRARRLRPFSLVATAVAGTAMLAQRLILGSDGRSTLFDFSPRWLVSSITQNLRASDEFWNNAWSPAAAKLVFLAALALMVCGLWAALRSGIRIYDLFALFYVLLIVPYPYVTVRYLLPIVPVQMVYLALGFELAVSRVPRKAAAVAAACALLSALASYGSQYAAAATGPIREGVSDPDFVALCEYARASTPPGSRFVIRKPRVFTLLADRPAATYGPSEEPEDLRAFIQAIHASYLVWGDPPAIDFDTDLITLQRFINQDGDHLTLIYWNSHYRLYRIS